MKIKTWLSAFTAVTLLLASCQKEQSDFGVSDIPNKATLEGTVVYSLGVDVSGSDYTQLVDQYAIGKKVFIDISYSELGDKSALGDQTYEATVDSTGKFSIEIPTTLTGVTPKLRLEEFTALYSEYKGLVDGAAQFEKSMYKFTYNSTSTSSPFGTVKAGEVKTADVIKYTGAKLDLTAYTESATLTGSVLLAIETAYRVGSYSAATSKNVEISVAAFDGTTALDTLTYGVQCDASGKFSLDVPILSLTDGFKVTKVAVPETVSTFKHWSGAAKTIELSGAYSLSSDNSSQEFDETKGFEFKNINNDIACDLGKSYLAFVPSYNYGNEVESSNGANYTYDLAGWVVKNSAFKQFDEQTVTVSGKVYLPRESSYGVGEYYTAVASVKVTIDNVDFVVATDAQGSYSFAYPCVDVVAMKTPSVELYQPVYDLADFVHYTVAGKSETIAGNYSQRAKITAVGAANNEVGSVYLKFTPTSGVPSVTASAYKENLAGWAKDSNKTASQTVTATIYVPTESGYCSGVNSGANGVFVKINDGTTDYYALASSGKATVDVPVASSDETLTCSASLLETTNIAYTHYYEAAKSTSISTMEYDAATTTVKAADAAWYNLGSIYYKVKANVTATVGTTTYTVDDKLIGWVVADDSKPSTVSFSGSVLRGVESSYLTGAFQSGSYMKMSATVGGDTYSFPATASGTFNVTVACANGVEASTVTVSPASTSCSFTHYNTSSTNYSIAGSYSQAGVIAGSSDSDKGTIYCTFAPSPSVSTFVSNLAGWKVPTSTQTAKTFTGTIMVPKETGYRTGGYDPASNYRVTLNGYVYLTNSLGQVTYSEIPTYPDSEVSAPTLTLSAADMAIYYSFNHVRTSTDATFYPLEVSYKDYQLVKDATDATTMGTLYLQFNLTKTTPATEFYWFNDYTFTQIAGWRVLGTDDTKQLSTTLDLDVMAEAGAGISVGIWNSYASKYFKYTVTTDDGKSYGPYFAQSSALGYATISLTVDKAATTITGVSVELYNENSKFTHYETDGSTSQLEGAWSVAASSSNTFPAAIVGGSLKYYIEFTPASAPSNWNGIAWAKQ